MGKPRIFKILNRKQHGKETLQTTMQHYEHQVKVQRVIVLYGYSNARFVTCDEHSNMSQFNWLSFIHYEHLDRQISSQNVPCNEFICVCW